MSILDFNGITSSNRAGNCSAFPKSADSAASPRRPLLTIGAGSQQVFDQSSDKVTINTKGNFEAAGDNGAALSADSIGGGGGSVDLALNFANASQSAGGQLGIDSVLGGNDGGNDAGNVIVTSHEGNLTTSGANTPAVFFQTIGGGGGRTSIDLSGPTSEMGPLTMQLGSTNMTDLAGGDIGYGQTGSVAASGDRSIGLFAQSVGGGGGYLSLAYAPAILPAAQPAMARAHPLAALGSATATEGSTVTLGANGGSGLDGGAIALSLTGDTAVQGNDAPGMVYQSIGGGGGTANLSGIDGFSVILGGSNGASGNGGDVSLINAGNVSTSGSRSPGLLLQSIGGGGGAVFGDGPGSTVTLSSGNDGTGGAITLNQTGDIVTSGANSPAVVAQSLGGGGGYAGTAFAGTAGGTGAGGAITLNFDGNVIAGGTGSSALVVQSEGRAASTAQVAGVTTAQAGDGNAGGNIAITLTAGHTIMGGIGAPSIVLTGGDQVTFDNAGTIAPAEGLSGMAIFGGTGTRPHHQLRPARGQHFARRRYQRPHQPERRRGDERSGDRSRQHGQSFHQ